MLTVYHPQVNGAPPQLLGLKAREIAALKRTCWAPDGFCLIAYTSRGNGGIHCGSSPSGSTYARSMSDRRANELAGILKCIANIAATVIFPGFYVAGFTLYQRMVFAAQALMLTDDQNNKHHNRYI